MLRYLDLSLTHVTGDVGGLSNLTMLAHLDLLQTAVGGDVGSFADLDLSRGLFLSSTHVTGWPLHTMSGCAFLGPHDYKCCGGGFDDVSCLVGW